MNPAFERRLVFVNSIAICAALVALVVAGAIIAFASHVRGLQGQINDTLTDIRAYVSVHGEPQTAPDLAKVVAARFFLPDVDVVVLDPSNRAEVKGRTAATGRQGLPYATVEVSPRRESRPPGSMPSRLGTALAASFGLVWAHATFESIDVVVRPNDALLVATVTRFAPAFTIAAFLALALGIVLARVLARQALRPLVDVTAALERFAAGDLSPQPIPADRKHQLGALAVAYNGAIAEVARAFAERDRAHAAMQQFIADAGHQLRTPLTVIRGFIAVLRKGELRGPQDRDKILATMNRQSLVMGSLIDKLILLDRWEQSPSNGKVEPIDVAQFVEDVVSPIASALPGREVSLDVDHGATASIDPSDLAHAVTNLVDNALKYTSGRVDVSVRGDGPSVLIEVSDRGPGMAPDELHHAFDRFYRGETRRDVDGSGLGLSIAKTAITRAGGTLAVESDPSRGSHFIIALPSVSIVPPMFQRNGRKVS